MSETGAPQSRGRAIPTRTAFLAGLALGAFLGFALLIAGPLTLLIGMVAVAWMLLRLPRLAGLSGSLIGFGAVWLLLLGQATYSCANDPSCAMPGGTGTWLLTGGMILAAGVLVGLLARRQPRA